VTAPRHQVVLGDLQTDHRQVEDLPRLHIHHLATGQAAAAPGAGPGSWRTWCWGLATGCNVNPAWPFGRPGPRPDALRSDRGTQ
jgi:hypothetical protein